MDCFVIRTYTLFTFNFSIFCVNITKTLFLRLVFLWAMLFCFFVENIFD